MKRATTIEDIVQKAKSYLPRMNEDRIRAAYEFARKAHEGQKRFSGEPYIYHPLEVTRILLDLKPDEDSIVASLLHDVIEDGKAKTEEIRGQFGDSVMPLLRGLEKLGTVYYRGQERQIENLRKMFLAMAKDMRVILIKLSDRLHNMRTLQYIDRPDKQKRIADETLSIYSPIASRLGIYTLKNELDTLCFKYLFPKDCERITEELDKMSGQQNNIIHKSKAILMKMLGKEGATGVVVEGRIKNSYSIYKKLKQKDKNYVSELYDVFALRVIVASPAECYQTLGLIHKHWTPLSRRFKDYIAVPKPNGYQSLHTTIIGLCPKLYNQPIEIQIRTREMNDVAEFGIASHWNYEEQGKPKRADKTKLEWVRSLVELHENLKSNSEFIKSLSVDIFHDRIFALTPKGDVLDLPYGATPIDFAYEIHTHLGHCCRGAKVNGAIVPLDFQLKNGQVVEILTGPAEQPNRYWLSFAVTSKAKGNIKQWFNAQDRTKIIRLGKDMLNKKLRQLNQPVLDPTLSLLKNYQGNKLTIKEREIILEKVGNGTLNPADIVRETLPEASVLHESTKKEVNEALAEGVKFAEKKPEILITGEKGHKTIIASCCQPKPNEPIIGYITRGRGVTIHKQTCTVLKGLEGSRFIKTSWSTEQKVPKFTAKLCIERRSRIGLLRDVTDVIYRHHLPIRDVANFSEEASQGHLLLIISLDSLETLDNIIRDLENVEGVFSVKEVD